MRRSRPPHTMGTGSPCTSSSSPPRPALVGAAASASPSGGWPRRGRARLAFGGALVLAAVACLLAVFVRYGGPVTIAQQGLRRVYDDDAAARSSQPERAPHHASPAATASRSLARGLARLRATIRCSDQGPGRFEQYWNKHRPIKLKVRDAHSLYLEMLAELGPVGLAPARRGAWARHSSPPFARAAIRSCPASLAAYVAYLAHAGVDWDWEMPAVTLAALACAAALLAAPRERDERVGASRRACASESVRCAARSWFRRHRRRSSGASALAASERGARQGPLRRSSRTGS